MTNGTVTFCGVMGQIGKPSSLQAVAKLGSREKNPQISSVTTKSLGPYHKVWTEYKPLKKKLITAVGGLVIGRKCGNETQDEEEWNTAL